MHKRKWKRNWMVITAGTVHLLWGVVLLFSDAPTHTTPLGHVPYIGWPTGLLYILVSLMAFTPHSRVLTRAVKRIWPRCPDPLDEHYAGLLLTLPQQGLLMMSFFTAMWSIIAARYPDGYVPDTHGDPRLFIFVDQLWSMMGMIAHTLSLLDWYWWSRRLTK